MAPKKAAGKSSKPSPRAKAAKTKVKNKPMKRTIKPSTKTVGSKKAKVLVKSAAKTLAQTAAKSAKKTGKNAKSPKRPNKPVKSTKGHTKSPVKSPGRGASKSPGRKSPVKAAAPKSPARPQKKLAAKSPGRQSPKAPGRPTAKTRAKPTVKSPVKSPQKRASNVRVVATVLKKWISPKSPIKIKTSPTKSSPGVSTRGIPLRKIASPSSTTKKVSTMKTEPRDTPIRRTVVMSKGQSSVQQKSPTDRKPVHVSLTSRTQQSSPSSPRKRPSVVRVLPVSPAKKSKVVVIGKSSKGFAQSKGTLSTPPRPTRVLSPSPRPTRVICPPARLLDAAPDKKTSTPTRASPMLKTPPKPTRLLPKAEARPTRSDMAARKDVGRKVQEGGSRSTGSVPQNVSPRQKVVAVPERPILKTEKTRSQSYEKGALKDSSGKPTPKKVTIVVPPKEASAEKNSSSPSSVSHPCKHCGLHFRSRSDAEHHEHRCDKNQSRSEKRYPCNKCRGMFTMSDLILHKKQVHPQREQNDAAPGETSTEEVKKVDGKPEKAPTRTPTQPEKSRGGLVFKVPSGGNLNDVIRQAVQAAANAGLVPPNKKVVISGPNMSSKVTTQTKPKRKSEGAERSDAGAESAGSKRMKPDASHGRAAVASPAVKPVVKTKPGTVPADAATAKGKNPQPKFFTCLDCGNAFPGRKEVSDHKAKCPGVGKSSVYACMECNVTFTTRAQLLIHKREKHVDTKSKDQDVTVRSYKCSACELFFPVGEEVQKHIDEIHGGNGESVMCNVVTASGDRRSNPWNRNISQAMVEEVITNIVNGVTKGKVPSAENKGKQADELASPTVIPSPIPSPALPVTPSPEPAPGPSPGPIPEPTGGFSVPGAEASQVRRPSQCLDCFKKVSSRLELAQHKRFCQTAIKNRQLFCFDCSSSFPTHFELNRHKQSEHAGSMFAWKCAPCDATFEKHMDWLEHSKTHLPPSGNAPDANKKGKQGKATEEKSPQKQSKEIAVVREIVPEKQPKRTSSDKTSIKPIEKKKQGEKPKTLENQEQVQRTRSGRIVQKKKQEDDDDIIIEKTVRGTKSKAKNPADSPKAIGTIEYLQQDVDNLKEEPTDHDEEKQAATKLTRKRTLRSTEKEGEPEKQSPPKQKRKPNLPSSDETEKESPTNPVKSSDVEVPHPPSTRAENGEGKPEGQTNISLANGLITISANKANDYQIFVDAKRDGSSIQVKLVRNEEFRWKQNQEKQSISEPSSPSPDKPKQDVRTTQPPEIEKAPLESPKPQQEPEKRVEIPAPKTNSPSPSKSNIQGSEDTVLDLTTSEPSTPTKPTTDKFTDTGKVVQKGKPFVIGGQTLVPIQFPPGFELPGGETGGQKVFAIPSTNLPPGLLQLVAKQNKAAAAAPPQPAKQKADTQTQKQAPESQPVKGTKSTIKKKPAILTPSPQKPNPGEIQEAPASLKGMTGAQLMARAQARILGRPLPPLKIDAPLNPGKVSSTQPKSTSTKTSLPAKGAPAPKKSPLCKNPMIATDCHKPLYEDPMFVYECTTCKQKFKSTGEINRHMKSCAGTTVPPAKRGRPPKRQKGTDVWHIKPVQSSKDEPHEKVADGEGVEWYVASKST